MNLKQFIFILTFGLGILFVFAALVAPFANKTVIESVSAMFQVFAFGTIVIGIFFGIALFAHWSYEKLEDET